MPLHIFEERYKRMIDHCLEHEEPFGIVFRDTETGARRVGCEARVTEVTERFDDGRLNIVVTGERPFRVLDRYEATEFPAGEVEPIAGTAADAPSGGDAPERAREAFAELVERVGGEPPERHELDALDSYGIAARVELPPDTQAAPARAPLRATPHGRARRRPRGPVATLERSQEIAERARMNGKVIVG